MGKSATKDGLVGLKAQVRRIEHREYEQAACGGGRRVALEVEADEGGGRPHVDNAVW